MCDYFGQPLVYRAMVLGKNVENVSRVSPANLQISLTVPDGERFFLPPPGQAEATRSAVQTRVQLGHPNNNNSGLEFFLPLTACPTPHMRITIELMAGVLDEFVRGEMARDGCRIASATALPRQGNGQYGVLVSLAGHDSSEALEAFLENTLGRFHVSTMRTN